ncbi:MAG: cyclase family protein [Acidobacteriota bacterium]|nr:cyclase family protein [Acidobacteriota bacterium]
MKIIDISPVISPRSAVFPGDQPFRREVALDFKQGHNLVLSSMTTTVHVGAHADAPSHYHPEGRDIASRDLSRYLGPCQVIRPKNLAPDARIYPHHIEEIPVETPRILFATDSFPDPDRWQDEFNSLSPDLVDYLADAGVVLVGIDTPSVDPSDSKPLESHRRIYDRDLAVLEGIVLTDVPEGIYFLSALPLRIEEADASPVRAVLIPTTDLAVKS